VPQVEHGDALVEAMERAVGLAPDDVALRSELVRILVEHDLLDRAREHCMRGLWCQPDHPELLQAGRTIASALGEHRSADAFSRLLDLLGTGMSDLAAAPAVEPEPRRDPNTATAGDVDAFLAEVLEEDERSRIRLDDIAGLDHVKDRLRASFLAPMDDQRLGQKYGVTPRGGLLLYGPPGCGKTHVARALAGELGLRFISVGLHDVLDMWFGASERNLHDLFQRARDRAPAVLFFDEVDAVGYRRSRLQASAGRNVVAQLLDELDPVESRNEGLFVLGATNAPWDVDPALRRPGRFDRQLFVAPPDRQARIRLFELGLQGRPLAGDVRTGALAEATDEFSGADIRLVCDAAAEQAMSEAIESGAEVPIRHEHLVEAARSTTPSTALWFQGARNVVAFGDPTGAYSDLKEHLQRRGRR
jgi:SpoVK/Ycf46/Vps4 family AAA+-type ATPase